MTIQENSIKRQMSIADSVIKKSKDLVLTIDLKNWIYPFIGIVVFLFIWSATASRIDTSLGQFPGPSQVMNQSKALVQEYYDEQDKEAAFDKRQAERNAKKLANNPDAKIKIRKYTGKETFFDQIVTSLKTVLFGFIMASIIAIPLGIVCGLSDGVYKAMNPLIQIFKPVSPLAWLPLITMVVSAIYTSNDPWFEKSFINSGLTVTLCCLWPTLINTAVGVANKACLMAISSVRVVT